MESLATDFAAALDTIDRQGDFCTSGTTELLAPRIVVEGAGPIALPLLPVQAEQLIALAERAPYGRGEETLTDTAVRRTWQIAPGKVQIAGRHWAGTIKTVLERAAEGLGVTDPVKAELYKVLIYDKGSFFVRHRDTEKAPGMFATLILVLPSLSAGGELVVRHKDREIRMDLRCEDPSEVAFAAFYADCVHEVLPVTEGYRLALVYNLMRSGPGRLPEPPDYANEQDGVTRLLTEWVNLARPADDDVAEKLVYPLEHAYTPAELGFGNLKGADAGVAKVVVDAAGKSGCEVHLALVAIEESGSAEYSDNSGSWRRSSRDDDDENFEVGEIFDRTVTASEWRRPDGEPSALTNIPVEDGEFSPPDAFEDLEPDEQHFREATGNEGASFDRTYRRAALVLWPVNRLLAIINQAGLRVTLPYLTDLASKWAAGGESEDSPSWRQAHELSGHMIDSWPTEHWSPRRETTGTAAGEMLSVLTRLKDVARLDAFLSVVATREGLDSDDCAAIADALRLLPPERAAALLHHIVAGAAGRSLAACGALLAQATVLGKAVVEGAAKGLVGALPVSVTRDIWRSGPGVEPGFIADLFTALGRIDTTLANRAAAHMLASPAVYDFDTVLIPGVRTLVEASEVADTVAVRHLRLACVAHLNLRVAETLEPPADWRRADTVACKCVHCAELRRFLADPARPKWEFRAVEHARGHVEGTIRTAGCDLTTTTLTRGPPYTLVCTKNQASYERRRVQRGKDLADLERLKG
ncbi:MAG: 2OG-Fe(II) oxygenase [Acetobacteraceae bacterium]|nr:2OG-Fe(II) oxygenase [Acetobacteraceae bacterium]